MKAKVEQQQGKIGRSHLVAKLRESGLSRRQSVQVVNAIPEAMIDALRRGEDVEFPYGQLSRIERYINKHWEAIDDLGRPDQNRSTVVYQVDMDAQWRRRKEKLAEARRASKSAPCRPQKSVRKGTRGYTRAGRFDPKTGKSMLGTLVSSWGHAYPQPFYRNSLPESIREFPAF